MMRRYVLLGTTALAGILAVTPPAPAAEVKPGGALDISVSGFARFLVNGGDTDEFLLDEDVSTGMDFFNDMEVHFNARGKDEATGIQYGATIEFEADTNATANTDETWIFLKGGFGEVRLGDEDGAADADGLVKGPVDIIKGIGTDGIEGDEWEEFLDGNKLYEPVGTSDATKVRYYTPSFGGFRAGVSYTPNLNGIGSGSNNGDTIASKDVEAGDVIEGGVQFDGAFGDIGLAASLTGLYGDVKDEDSAGGDDYRSLQGGVTFGVGGFEVGASYVTYEAGAVEMDAVSAAVAYGFGPLSVGVSGGYGVDTDGIDIDGNAVGSNPWLAILSATYALMPGVTLDGDLGLFDNDLEGGGELDGDGWRAIGRLGIAF